MTATCRAVVFLGDDRFDLREFHVPAPPPGGAVLRVDAVGLCGSDVAQFHGIHLIPGGSAFPVVPGHEIVGRVIALSPGAELGVAEGQRVAVDEILGVDPFRVYGYSDTSGEGRLVCGVVTASAWRSSPAPVCIRCPIGFPPSS